jgi:hypothetical protein
MEVAVSNDPNDLQQVALVPARLLAPGSEGRSWREAVISGADHVPEVAAEWQKLAGHATFLEMGGLVGGADRDRTWELVGRIAATGEQLGLAYTAAIEVDFWRQAKMATDTVQTAYEMGHRAMAELQAYFTIGSGHGLVNVAARTLALAQDLRAALASKNKKWRNAFPPFSESEGDWPALSQQTAARLSEVAALSPHPEVRELLKPVVTLHADERWRKLDAYRGKAFHRWRPQSAGGSIPAISVGPFTRWAGVATKPIRPSRLWRCR